VFARSYGPHNEQTKELLKKMQKELDIELEFIDVDLLPGFDSSLIMMELQRITGQWAFPNIFIGKQHVGGNSELDQLAAVGELEEMLSKFSAHEL
jgi:glutaredoxin 3